MQYDLLVFQQIYNWVRHPVYERKILPTEPLEKLYAQEEHARQSVDHKKRRNEILINLAEAVLYTGIVLFSSFVPGGFIITLASILMIGAVMLIKNRVNAANETWAKDKLDKAFIKYESAYEQTINKTQTLGVAQEKTLRFEVDACAPSSSGNRFFKSPRTTEEEHQPSVTQAPLNKR